MAVEDNGIRQSEDGSPARGHRRLTTAEAAVAVGFRVSTTTRDKFAHACKTLSLTQSEVVADFMTEFWRKFADEPSNTREDYNRLKRDADRLYDSFLGLRNSIDFGHWMRFKELYIENEGDVTEWPEQNARATLNLIYGKRDTLAESGKKCSDCNQIVRSGHFDRDFRRFETYIEGKVSYAQKNRKLEQLREILIQQERTVAKEPISNANDPYQEALNKSTIIALPVLAEIPKNIN